MKRYFARIDKFGRISIPKRLRTEAKLEGGFLEISVEKLTKEEERLILQPVYASSGNPVEDLIGMNLPIEDWKNIKKQLEGRFG
ncbi:MAG: hypothetical protein AABX01_06620 [Candidatus Micrarchaeota archaeon]|mgnify:CR=1 FL=1